jgi:hypothetical protein
MADSAFWRELATQFQLIPDYGMLRADGHYIIGSGVPWNWQLAGGASDFTRSAFEALARRGASEIASTGTPDLLVVWLEELRKNSFSFRFSGQANEVQDDGSDGRHYLMGSIGRVCQASATFCKKLEAQAVQAEFEEKQRSVAPTPESIPESAPAHVAQTAMRFRPLDVHDIGKKVIEAANRNPNAWEAALAFIDFQSSLNANTAPRPASKPATSNAYRFGLSLEPRTGLHHKDVLAAQVTVSMTIRRSKIQRDWKRSPSQMPREPAQNGSLLRAERTLSC